MSERSRMEPFCGSLVALAFLAGGTDAAAQVTYTVDRSVGAGRVTGTITTNGDLGVLTANDIVGWSLSIDADANGSSAQLSGPPTGPPPGPPGMPPGTPLPLHSLLGVALTATETGLFWDFRYATVPPPPGPMPPEPNILEFRSPDFSIRWQISAFFPGMVGETLLEPPNVVASAFNGTGLVQIATTVIAPLEITSDTTLTADRRGPIVIAADDVTLDCANRVVTGSGSGVGIHAAGRTGVAIKRCVVHGFSEGIVLEDSSDNLLSENSLSENVASGLRLTGSDRNRLSGNLVSFTRGPAALANGIVLQSSSSNRVEWNSVDHSDVAGVLIGDGSLSNELVGNVSSFNGGPGFDVASGSSSLFLRNTATRNGGFGFVLREESRRNKLLENSGCLNLPNDATELRAGRRSNSNIWVLNLFCSPAF